MRAILLAGAAAAGLMLVGCASGGYYGHGGGVAIGYDYNSPNDVYYDGYYGAYSDGYWGDGGVFFYRDSGGHYARDDSHHFREKTFQGSQKVRSSARPHQDNGNHDNHDNHDH